MSSSTTVTLLPGDGIGPEVTQAARRIIEAVGVPIVWEVCEAGEKVFKKGISSGLPQDTLDSIARNRVALKGPLQTPVGYGEKSANVTLRKHFETFGNIRPIRHMPGIQTPYKDRPIDFVVVRENVEDLYAGVEYRDTPGVSKALKLISRRGSEKIARLAFEVARSEGRKSVHVVSKANILKFTEGLFKKVAEEVAKDYPEIELFHVLVDNCAHQLVKRPEQFEVLLTTNMNGDILSDLGSALIGGLGLAPGANIGSEVSIFEAVHGSAPKYAGKNSINPVAVVLSSTMMLRFLGFVEEANKIDQAIAYTFSKGILTRDLAASEDRAVSTTVLTDHIIQNLGQSPDGWEPHDFKSLQVPQKLENGPQEEQRIVGLDVYLRSSQSTDELGKKLDELTREKPYHLSMMSSRGMKIYPHVQVPSERVDHARCRFTMRDPQAPFELKHIEDLIALLHREGYMWAALQKIATFDGERGYTLAQGE